jgi:hypothetical protein
MRLLRSFLALIFVLIVLSASPAVAATNSSVIHGMTATSATDVWATGYYLSGDRSFALALHWDGATWRIVPTSSTVSGSTFLNQPSAISSNDAWVVGDQGNKTANEGPGARTLAEHWNGSAWGVVSTPNVSGANQNVLRGCAALSPSDVWAGGYFKKPDGARQPLFVHWDGRAWRIVSSPSPSSEQSAISSVSGTTGSDVWAVGQTTRAGQPHSLIEHWNGTSWSIVLSPSPGVGGSYPEGTLLWSVSADAANDAWAVGQYFDGSGVRSLALHWDGVKWIQISTPNVGNGENQLRSVETLSPTDAWAVGWSNVNGVYQTLTEHWDGTSWSVVPSADTFGDNYLKGVAAVSSTDIWAAGYSSTTTYQTVTEHWDGSAWSRVPSPNA